MTILGAAVNNIRECCIDLVVVVFKRQIYCNSIRIVSYTIIYLSIKVSINIVQHTNMQIPKDILHLHILHYIILLLQPISDQSSPCKSSRRSHTASSKSAKATATQSSEVQITRPVRDISPSVSGIFHRTSLGGRSVLAEIRCKNEGLYRMTSKNLSNLMRNILNHIKSYLKPHCFQLHFLKLQPFLSLLIHVSKGAPSRPQGVLQSLQQRLRLCSFPWFRFCFTLEL